MTAFNLPWLSPTVRISHARPNTQQIPMGHSTNYTGKIRITNLDLDKVRQLKQFLGADRRDLVKNGVITEDQAKSLGCSNFCDMELDSDLTAIQWDGSEKTNGLENWLILLCGLCELMYQEGDSLVFQGESSTERGLIIIENGSVTVRTGAAEACGTEVYVCCGFYYDEFQLGAVFAKEKDAQDYIAKMGDTTLDWEIVKRALA